MEFSHLPCLLASAFLHLAACLDRRSALRLPAILFGILLAKGRRTVTSWFRAAGIADEFRPAYTAVHAVGTKVPHMARTVLHAIAPVLDRKRLLLAIDDSPTARYGPCVEGAGSHHNPTPGPAGEKYVYGHVWVTLAALAQHPDWGTLALPLQGQLYIREKDLPKLPPERQRPFRTKLELAAQQLAWLAPWVAEEFERLVAAVDGGYAKAPFLKPAKACGFTVISRLRKDAALWDLPPTERRPGQRGPMPTYGKKRFSLAKRAGQRRGWQQVECVQYGAAVTKTIKTFLATWRPAGGLIRVVLVQEEGGWLAYFSTEAEVTAQEILEAMADRGALEQTFGDEKEVWGAGQQQVRNVYSNEGCFNLNLWMYTLTELWAWDKLEEDLVDRSQSPWDNQPRRPSHADKRKALQLEVLRGEIEEVLRGRPTKEEIRALAERLLALAA
jgi:hypothetical protein